MTPMNKIEEAVLKLIEQGEVLHGPAREIWVDMVMREMSKN